MSKLFLSVLNMSLTASYVILLVMLVRLLLKKAPKSISYALWGVVAFRLIIPFSFESIFSLMPRRINVAPIPQDIIYQQNPQINSGIIAVDTYVSKSLPAPTLSNSVNPMQIYTEIGSYIWILGIVVLLAYSLASIVILKRRLKSAQFIESNIYEARNLKTPFVLGIVKPKIYLPVGLSAEERSYILLHEQAHIQRKDNIIKVIAFLILSIHWFNPFVWIAFMLMSTDMELSCDERVLKKMNEDIKKPYANSLLSLATARHILNGSPLAFGEGNVKGRIINVLNYKKPKFWFIVLSIILVISVGIGLIANPKAKETEVHSNNSEPTDSILKTTDIEPGDNKIKPIAKLEPTTAKLSLDQDLGVDFPFLDYASDDIVIFHGYFGLFVYDLSSQQIIRSLDLAPIDCQATQGDNYCEVSVSADGNTVLLHPFSSEQMYIYTISDNILEKVPYVKTESRFDGLVSTEDVMDFSKAGVQPGACSYHAVQFANGELGYLQAAERNIGSLTYVRGDKVFRLFGDATSNPIVNEDVKSDLIYKADVNGDGQEESIFIAKSQTDIYLPATLSICDSSGNEIWSKQFAIAHAGWGSLFLCELDGKQYLLSYDPSIFQGYAAYTYSLFTLEGGKEKVSRSNTIEFDINGITELNPSKMVAFADEVNELLKKSILLMSTEGGDFYIGPTSAELFFERYSWLDLTPELYDSNDDLETKLVKYNEYAMQNYKQYQEKYFPKLSDSNLNSNSDDTETAAPAMPGGLPKVYPEDDTLNEPFRNAVLLPDVYWETSNKTNYPKEGSTVSIPSGRPVFAFLPTRPREEKSIYIDEATLKKLISEVNTAKVLSTGVNWAQADIQEYCLILYVLTDGNVYNRIYLTGPIYYKKDVYVNISVESIDGTYAYENWRVVSPALGQMLIDIWGPKFDPQRFHDVTRIDMRVLNSSNAGNKATLEGSAARDIAKRMLETSKVVTGYGKCGYNIEVTFTFSDGTTALGWLNGDSCTGIAMENGPSLMFDKEITRELYKLLDYGEDFIPE